MNGRLRWMITSATRTALAFVLVGCGDESPPYDDLPLRDALQAAPEVVASMPFEARLEIARRLDTEALEHAGELTIDAPEAVTIDTLARVADDTRGDQGRDALVLGEVSEGTNKFVIRADEITEEALGRVNVGPIYLHGHAGAQTEAFEDSALRGRAGAWLRELSGRTNANHFVRTTGLPFGAWAFDDAVYVNASWLVAMSALEENANGVLPGNGSIMAIQPPAKTPLTVDYNPYNLPDTIAECAQQVADTCLCGTSCTQPVTDPTFANGNEECAWVNQDVSRPAALCVLALMSIDDVRACVESAGGQCSALPVTNRDAAVVFAQNTSCMDLLDICLRDGYIPQPSSGSSCNGCSGCGSNACSNSNNSCSSCNDSCSNCNSNWSKCNQNCSDSNQNCSNTGQNANSCGKCSVKPEQGQSPLPAPVGSMFWLIAPAAYVLMRNRRRS